MLLIVAIFEKDQEQIGGFCLFVFNTVRQYLCCETASDSFFLMLLLTRSCDHFCLLKIQNRTGSLTSKATVEAQVHCYERVRNIL